MAKPLEITSAYISAVGAIVAIIISLLNTYHSYEQDKVQAELNRAQEDLKKQQYQTDLKAQIQQQAIENLQSETNEADIVSKYIPLLTNPAKPEDQTMAAYIMPNLVKDPEILVRMLQVEGSHENIKQVLHILCERDPNLRAKVAETSQESTLPGSPQAPQPSSTPIIQVSTDALKSLVQKQTEGWCYIGGRGSRITDWNDPSAKLDDIKVEIIDEKTHQPKSLDVAVNALKGRTLKFIDDVYLRNAPPADHYGSKDFAATSIIGVLSNDSEIQVVDARPILDNDGHHNVWVEGEVTTLK